MEANYFIDFIYYFLIIFIFVNDFSYGGFINDQC